MCEKCKDGGNILDGYLNTTKGEVFTRLRFDLDNNQFDMQYGIMDKDESPDEFDWTHSIDISFCPFCGKRLPITTTITDLIEFVKPDIPAESISNTEKMLLLMIEGDISVFNASNINLIDVLTNKYRTEVKCLNKTKDTINIFFKEPKHKHIKEI